jgi:hypothetical protein
MEKTERVWYKLYQRNTNDTGLSEVGRTSTFIPHSAYVDDFRRAVFEDHRKLDFRINFYRITVFENCEHLTSSDPDSDSEKSTLDQNGVTVDAVSNSRVVTVGTPLEPTDLIGDLGRIGSPLIVVIPNRCQTEIPSDRLRKKPRVVPSTIRTEAIIQAPLDCATFRYPPDSERVSELLPQKATMDHLDGMHFVNRDDSAKALFKVFASNYETRSGSGNTYGYQVALFDSIYGMGKSSFSGRFLSLIEKMKLVDELRTGVERECHTELRRARSLRVVLNAGQLIEFADPSEELRKQITYSLKSRVFESESYIPNLRTLQGLLTWVSSLSPLVLILDRIGAAFRDRRKSLSEQRECFLKFIERECLTILNIPGIYLVLSGRAQFIARWNEPVGQELRRAAVRIARINLNPLKRNHITEVLMNTSLEGKKLSEIIPKHPDWTDQSLDEIADKLYEATGGNPRSIGLILMHSKMSPLRLECAPFDLSEVLHFAKLYPDDLKILYTHHSEQSIVDLSVEKNGLTYEYLASRIYAGFGLNIERTTICIPPSVVRFLERISLPLDGFLSRWKKVDVLLLYDRARNIEWTISKWFESIFKTSGFMGDLMNGFLPSGSICQHVPLQIKRVFYDNIESEPKELKRWATKLVELDLNREMGDIYFPAYESWSPNMIIVPRAEFGSSRIVIGVVVWYRKCNVNSSVSRLRNDVEKFNRLITEMCTPTAYKGVLLIVITKPHTDLIPISSRSCLYESGTKNVEVVLVNLGSPELRGRFLEAAAGLKEEHARILDEIIQSEIS